MPLTMVQWLARWWEKLVDGRGSAAAKRRPQLETGGSQQHDRGNAGPRDLDFSVAYICISIPSLL